MRGERTLSTMLVPSAWRRRQPSIYPTPCLALRLRTMSLGENPGKSRGLGSRRCAGPLESATQHKYQHKYQSSSFMNRLHRRQISMAPCAGVTPRCTPGWWTRTVPPAPLEGTSGWGTGSSPPPGGGKTLNTKMNRRPKKPKQKTQTNTGIGSTSQHAADTSTKKGMSRGVCEAAWR